MRWGRGLFLNAEKRKICSLLLLTPSLRVSAPLRLCVYFLVPLLLASLASCGKNSPASEKPSMLVTTQVVEAKDVPVHFEYIAQTQSSHEVNIQSRVSGFLDHRVYTEGSIVDEDQILFVMDKKPFEAQLKAAQASVQRQDAALETARLNLNRVKPLAALDALSQKDLDDANGTYLTNAASLEQMKAQLITAELNLSYCTIRSPIKGITGAAKQQDGSYLNVSNSQLTTVSALDPMWVNFSLSDNQLQSYSDEIQAGRLIPPENHEYLVKVIQINGKIFPHTGQITFRQPYFNPDTGTFLIRASVANPDAVLWPNQYVHARVEGAIRPNAILVSQKAVQQSSKGNYVWVIDKDDLAEMRPVTVGEWQDDNWFINSGLQSGEKVVVEGAITLYSGAKVKEATK